MRTAVITFFGLYTINQDETGVILTLGSFSREISPGLGFIIPILQTVVKTKASVQTLDLPDQKIVLSGNISVKISGSVNFKVSSARRALLEVNDYQYSLRQLALTTISDVLGTKTIEEIRSNKNDVANEIENIVSKTAVKWGLSEVDIRLTDAEMDDKLLRAMMRETEAEKEASAIKIKAQADENVAKIFSRAAQELSSTPGAMTLRILQTLSDLSNDKSTIVIPLPIEILEHFRSSQKVEHTPLKPLPISMVFNDKDGKKADCPKCSQRYKVDNVLQDKRFDVDPEMPGIQLCCKKCNNIFTLEAS